MKVLASDFDLTLYVKDIDVVKKNIEAISRFMKRGNIFCIITGRNYSNIKVLLNEYKIPYHYLVCQDGAKIFDFNDFCFFTEYLSSDKIKYVVSIIEKYDFSYYLDDGYNKTDNINDCVKVVVLVNDRFEDAKRMIKEFDNKKVYAYLSTKHVNIIDSSVNKKSALEKVLVHADCYKDDLYVIGDSVNDLEMLTAYQGGIMKEHSIELDDLPNRQYDTLYEYIEELEKN